MASGDTFEISSWSPVLEKGAGAEATSYAPDPIFARSTGDIGSYSVALRDVSLFSVSPDPVLYGQVLVVTGINLHLVQVIRVDGVVSPFTIVSSAQINVTLPLLSAGVKSIQAEYV